MWRKPSGQITSASNVGKGDKSDSDALEVGDDYKKEKREKRKRKEGKSTANDY